MTEKNVIAIDDPKSETMNSSMTPRINSMLFTGDHSMTNQETGGRPSDDGPSDKFVDKRESNEFGNLEKFATLVSFRAAKNMKKKDEVATKLPKFTPILLENQATSIIESTVDSAEEGKDEKKKHLGDELDDEKYLLIKDFLTNHMNQVQEILKNFPRWYGIHQKDHHKFKVLGPLKDTISGKGADINHPKELEDLVSTYITETVKSDDLTRSQGVNVDGASPEPSVIRKQDEAENEGFCHMSGCDSGISERESLQGFINQEDVDNEHGEEVEADETDLTDDIKPEDIRHGPGINEKNVDSSSGNHDSIQKKDVTENIDNKNFCHRSKCDSGFSDPGSQQGCFTNTENGESEHRKEGKDDKTLTVKNGPLQDDPTSEALDQTLDTNPKDQGRDSDRVQKKDVQENRHTSQVTTCDSGFSDREHLQIFASHEDSDGAHPAGKEDDESAVKRAESQSVDPVPNLNPDDKMTGVGDQGNIENEDGKGDSTSLILGADKAHNPQKQMSAKRDQGHLQTKEIRRNHAALKKVPDSDASVLGSLQDRKSRNDQDTIYHKEEHDDTKNRRDDRRSVLLDPDPSLSTTCAKRDRSAKGDQGNFEGKTPAEIEDISHVTSCDSDASVLGSVRPPEGTSQRDCDSGERPKEEGKVDVTDKNDAGGQRVYSKPDPELSCNSHGTKQAKVDPILQRPNKKKTLIKTGYSGVQIFRFPLFLIALICTPSVLSVLGNMNLVWYKEGDNAIIYFSFESYDAESAEMILNVRMQSVQKPFYSNGIIEYDGFKYDSQIERFNVSTDGKGLKIEITHFQSEDEDVFILTQISFRDNGDPDGLSRRIQLKLLTPAQCNVLSGSSLIIVHCTDAVATPETAIFCFQGISFCSPYSRGDTADGQAEFRMKNSGEPIRCCSKAQVDPSVSISASHENCHDFIWLPTMPTIPTSTHDHDGVVTSSQGVSVDSDGDIAPYQTIPHTPSSCSRVRYVQSLIISLLLSWFLV